MRLLAFASTAVLVTGCGIKRTPTPTTSATGFSKYAFPCAGTRYATVVNAGRDPVAVRAYGGGGELGVVEPGRESTFALTDLDRYVTIAGRRGEITGARRAVRITYQCQ